jgi:hypothetical protein
MVDTLAPTSARRYATLEPLAAGNRVARSTTGNPRWQTRGWELRVCLTAALTGFVAACGGLLAVIALRGYTIYG